MTIYLANVHLLFELDESDDSEASIPDALNSILTEDMRKYSRADSCLIDWAFAHGDAASAITSVDIPADYDPDESPFPMPADPVRDAAPDMLAALKVTVAALLATHGEPPLLQPPGDRERRPSLYAAWAAIESGRAAIAKAEGRANG